MKRKAKNFLKRIWYFKPVQFVAQRLFVAFEYSTNYKLERRRFYKRTGYKLELNPPRSFNHKIVYKKLYDRNPLLPIVADKYRVREHVKTKLGPEIASQVLIPLLYVTDDPETIPFSELPDKYVIKANHASGRNILVHNANDVNKDEIIKTCKQWLKEPYGFFKHEWAYSQIDRKIVIEKMLLDNGSIPKDFKFHMFNGKWFMTQVNEGDFADKAGRNLTLLDTNWDMFDVFWEFAPMSEAPKKPSKLKEMIKISEKLSEDFDYLRVDLYCLDSDDIYFGEMTLYPTSGSPIVKPSKFDFWLGEEWEKSVLN